MTPTSPLVDQLSDNAIFARELGFIRETEILAALEASGMITTREHADLYADLSAVYCPVYQPRTLGFLTG